MATLAKNHKAILFEKQLWEADPIKNVVAFYSSLSCLTRLASFPTVKSKILRESCPSLLFPGFHAGMLGLGGRGVNADLRSDDADAFARGSHGVEFTET